MIDSKISHEEFKTTVNEKKSMKKMKEETWMMKNNDKLSKNKENLQN